ARAEPTARRGAASALGGIAAPVAPELLAAIGVERDPNVLQALIYAVARVPPPAGVLPSCAGVDCPPSTIEDALVKASASEAAPVREAAVWSLGQFPSERARHL